MAKDLSKVAVVIVFAVVAFVGLPAFMEPWQEAARVVAFLALIASLIWLLVAHVGWKWTLGPVTVFVIIVGVVYFTRDAGDDITLRPEPEPPAATPPPTPAPRTETAPSVEPVKPAPPSPVREPVPVVVEVSPPFVEAQLTSRGQLQREHSQFVESFTGQIDRHLVASC